jgi:branched-chain amino acid transport system substrate-binding protein
MTLHRATAIAAGLAAALALAACGSGSSSTTSSSAGGDIALSLENCGELEYGGEGQPDALIVSDLPMQGDSAERSKQQVEAIRVVLDRSDWKAGDTTVGFQACDDSIAKTGLWDEDTCRANAEAYGSDEAVVGVIGTYNSGCAALEIPILNRAGVAMISPGNTAVCLTQKSPICTDGQPGSLYPNGRRNYARVIPNDAFQGAALATFAQQQGVKQPAVLYAADDPTSEGQAENFRGAADELGLDVVDYATWDPKAKSYSDLFDKAQSSGADGIVLAGLTEQNGGQVIQDKVAVLGPNSKLPLIAFDGLAQQSTIDKAGSASRGMFASVPGTAPENLTGEGKSFVDELSKRVGGKPIEQFAPFAGEAAAVMLDAIAKGGTDREAVVNAVFATHGGGILGPYTLEDSGDPSVGPITVFEAESTFKPFREIRPKPDVVKAALG